MTNQAYTYHDVIEQVRQHRMQDVRVAKNMTHNVMIAVSAIDVSGIENAMHHLQQAQIELNNVLGKLESK